MADDQRKGWVPKFPKARILEAEEMLRELSERREETPKQEASSGESNVPDDLKDLECPHCGNPVFGDVRTGEVRYQGTSFDNPKFREEVESRCPPIDTTMLGTTGRIYQDVPAFPGNLELRFRTQCPEESRRIARMARDLDMPGMFNVFDGQVLNIAASLVVAKGAWVGAQPVEFQDPLTPKSGGIEWDEQIFMKNLSIVRTRFSTMLVTRIIPQLLWFMQRCEAFMSPVALKKS